jgi:hypothetical protein
MLSKSDISIEAALKGLGLAKDDIGLAVPSEINLRKGNMDAHKELRDFLFAKKIHNYESQAKGSNNKVLKPIALIGKEELVQSSISLYRPETKLGDPRFWIYGLSKYSSINNLILIFTLKGKLYALNASDPEILSTKDIHGSPLNLLLSSLISPKKVVVEDLDPAPVKQHVDNLFLIQLKDLQQDGSESISLPNNWAKKEPLLRVTTELDEVIEEQFSGLKKCIASDDEISWHFFVGSPGNGKSAATGALVRKFLAEGFSVIDEVGNNLSDDSVEFSQVPYLLSVFESGKKYSKLWIAQDASVVRNPFGENADPSLELIDLVKAAIKANVSLIVCTNRGVLEKSARYDGLTKSDLQEPWYVAIKQVSLGKKIQEINLKSQKNDIKLTVTTSNLEKQSLVFGSDIGKRVIETAVANDNWFICNKCSSANFCPFFNNRNWLSTEEGKNSLISLAQYAELLSGQLIVFREFLAFISLLLSGCPKDYEDGTPCQWVHKQIQSENFFALVARRIYMLLFSSYAPIGIESAVDLKATQILSLKSLINNSENLEKSTKTAIESALKCAQNNDLVSTDVGIQRLLKKDGEFSLLDINNGPMKTEFIEKWSIGSHLKEGGARPLMTDLEFRLIDIFSDLSKSIEDSASLSAKNYFWLSRWYSSFFFRLGSLVENYYTLGSEISRLAEILNITDTEQFVRKIGQIENQLNELLLGQDTGVKVSEFGRLKGRWIDKLSPNIEKNDGSGLGIPIKFGEEDESETLNALAFVWLLRKVESNMSIKSFPIHHLETLQDALIRAASVSHYSTSKDVELEIILPGKKSSTLSRSRGYISVK